MLDKLQLDLGTKVETENNIYFFHIYSLCLVLPHCGNSRPDNLFVLDGATFTTHNTRQHKQHLCCAGEPTLRLLRSRALQPLLSRFVSARVLANRRAPREALFSIVGSSGVGRRCYASLRSAPSDRPKQLPLDVRLGGAKCGDTLCLTDHFIFAARRNIQFLPFAR